MNYKLIKGKGSIELNKKEAQEVTKSLLSCKSKFEIKEIK